MSTTFTITIDGQEIPARRGETILQAALAAGIDIPHLCHDPRLEPAKACRICAVGVNRQRGYQMACGTLAEPDMQVLNEIPEIASLRKQNIELLLAAHNVRCISCESDGDCELQKIAFRYGADDKRFGAFVGEEKRPNYTEGNLGIDYDPELCIRCGRCVRYCGEVQMARAITWRGRSNEVEVSTAFGIELNESECEHCGGCIRLCPTGAMYEQQARGKAQARDLRKVRTVCTYCGTGCQIDLNVHKETGKIVRVTSDPATTTNGGNLCVKGHFAFDFVDAPDRLTYPQIRRNGAFERASWDESVALIGKRFREIREKHGPDSVAFLASSCCTNEENYLMQKLARAAMGTNMIDQCATPCHAPSVAGLKAAFGSGAMTNSTAEIRDVDVMFVIGSNATEAHPVLALEMKKALKRGATLIVADPRKIWLARHADIHLKLRPGSDNMLINAMLRHILDLGLENTEFIESRCENYAEFRDSLNGFDIEAAAAYCGVDAALIRQAAEAYARGNPSAIYYTMGITEHTCGTDNVKNLANLAMLCGQVGKRSSGVNPLRGQNNVQGACDMGAQAHVLPGYQTWADPETRAKFEKKWKVTLPQNRGGTITDFIEQAEAGTLKALYIMGEDPVVSEPNQKKVIAAFKNLEFLVCQEILLSETAKLADVILPATCFAEKDGTFTSTERRVQRVRKAVDPPGEALPDWQILLRVSKAMGYKMSYKSPSKVWDEMASLTPLVAGINYARIEEVGLQWPCPTTDHPGTAYLHKDRFTRGLGHFAAITFAPPREVPDKKYPLILSTGVTLYHCNASTMTRRSVVSDQKQPENFVEMHPETAKKYGVKQGETIGVETRRGKVEARAEVNDKARPDTIWMPFHFLENPANAITNDVFDPITGTPEFKCCAARIVKGKK